MRILTIALAIVCLGSFAWARRSFFLRGSETRPNRSGLRPLGTIFGLGAVISLAWNFRIAGSVAEVAGVAAMICSQLLFWWAVHTFGARPPMIAFTDRAPLRLVTSGPYRWVRHPFYVSYELFWIGALVSEPNVITAGAVLVMGALYLKAAREEEAGILKSIDSSAYRAYQGRTGMFIPRIIGR